MGCLVIVGAIVGGLVLGVAVTLVLDLVFRLGPVAAAVGTGAWLISSVLMIAYGQIFFFDPREFEQREASSVWGRWHDEKAERKLQSAELRSAFVFGLIGFAASQMGQAPIWVGVLIAISLGIVGGFVGYDIKRRVRAIRQRLEEYDESDGPRQ